MSPLLTRLAPLALLSLVGLFAACVVAWRTVRHQEVPALPVLPQRGPWERRISALGVVEGDGPEIRVGVPETGLVTAVEVTSGQAVRAGKILFRLDDQAVRADLAVAEADLATDHAALATAKADAAHAAEEEVRVASLPRREDVGPAEARRRVAEAQLADARVHLQRINGLFAKGATTAEQVDLRHGAESVAAAQLGCALAELEHVRLGAWEPDLRVARASADAAATRVASAQARISASQARIAAIRTRLDRLTIRAPRNATVVALDIAVGASASPADRDLVVLADLGRLLVRVEVDESQAWKLHPGAAGRGWVRGAPERTVELAYERTEPLAGARQALAGRPGERLDGRAMRVLYRIDGAPAWVHPGFLLEVDLDAGGGDSRVAPAPGLRTSGSDTALVKADGIPP